MGLPDHNLENAGSRTYFLLAPAEVSALTTAFLWGGHALKTPATGPLLLVPLSSCWSKGTLCVGVTTRHLQTLVFWGQEALSLLLSGLEDTAMNDFGVSGMMPRPLRAPGGGQPGGYIESF